MLYNQEATLELYESLVTCIDDLYKMSTVHTQQTALSSQYEDFVILTHPDSNRRVVRPSAFYLLYFYVTYIERVLVELCKA